MHENTQGELPSPCGIILRDLLKSSLAAELKSSAGSANRLE